MSAYIKSIDPNHLVLLGHSGVFGASTPDLCAHLPSFLRPASLPPYDLVANMCINSSQSL